MKLLAPELWAINVALQTLPLRKEDRPINKEVRLLIMASTTGEGEKQNFVDGEIELTTVQKAYLIGILPEVNWVQKQWDELIDPLLEKLN